MSPTVRGRLAVAAALSLVLVTAVCMLLRPQVHPRIPHLTADWTTLPGPAGLPGSPLADTPQASATPAPIIGLAASQRNAAAPFAERGPAARPFHFVGAPEDRARARTCLAAAMLYEAGGDAVGQLAVGQVVLNRVRHPAFPANICAVVTQGSERTTGCQFTFTCDGALARRVGEAAGAAAGARADAMLNGFVFEGVGLATHYHTDQVYPWWSSKLEKIARVGSHLFFRWPGYWGSARAATGKRLSPEASAALFAALGGKEANSAGETPRIAVHLGFNDAEPALAGSQSSPSGLTGLRAADSAAAIPVPRRLRAPESGSSPSITPVALPILGGNRLLRMFPEEGTFYLQLMPGAGDAALRKAAQALCGGRLPCRVYGWREAQHAPASGDPAEAEKAAADFRFEKSSALKAPVSAPAALMF